MKERINKLARGIVDLACPELRLSDTAFHGMVCAGETLKLDLTLTSENGILLKGLIYSDSPYVTIQKNTFLGLRTRISALVDARALEDGDHIEGGLCIVSNGGETRIPFAFEVRSYASAEVIPGLRTPEDFVKLYQTNGGAALRVFEYDDFVRAPFMIDARFRALYDGLRKGPDRVHALEAFLYAIRYPKQETTTRMPRAESGCTKETLNRADVPVEALEDAELIEEAAGCCIRAGATTELAFRIYQRAIEMQSQITRLYEYYMYAMPKGYQGRLPREVYLYFAYEYDIPENMKLPLFYNVVMNFGAEEDIYQRFEKKIQKFTIDQLLKSAFDQRLSVLYERMVLVDMVDERIGTVLPAILRAYRVSTSDPRMRYVVVRYLELQREELYPLKEGSAYIPLFFENSVLLFQDAYGDRYTDISYEKTRIMEKPELEKRCFQVVPEQPMLKLARARRIARNGIQSAEELQLLESVIREMPLAGPYRAYLLNVILRYLDKLRDSATELSEEEKQFLAEIPQQELDHSEQKMLLQILIRQNMFEEAYRRMLSSGERDLDRPYLEKLVRSLVASERHTRSAELMDLGYDLFTLGTKDRTILRYLMEYYNGLSGDMLAILLRGQKLKVDGQREMAERLLAQMLFSRTEQGLDDVFELYRSFPDAENVLLRAYITKRAVDYFIDGRVIREKVFSDIYGIVRDERYKERVPVIYLLAMSKHMSEQKDLNGEEKLVLQDTMDYLIRKKLIFAYTRTLYRFVRIPDSVMDRYYIEYHGHKDIRPSLYLRILPDQGDYEEEEIVRIYQNIYVRPVTLFAGERAEYQIYESTKDQVPATSGSIAWDGTVRLKGDTYDILSEMSGLIGKDQDQELYEAMHRYVRNEAVIEALFTKEMTEAKSVE